MRPVKRKTLRSLLRRRLIQQPAQSFPIFSTVHRLAALLALAVSLASSRAEDAKPAATMVKDPTEISFEELVKLEIPTVEGASKYKQKITEAPSSVTIITSDEVKKYGHRTLADILATAPGLYTSYDRNYSFLGVRGFNLGDNNNRVLLLVDGHRINNSLSDGAYIGTEFILDADLIDRVEIIRGPGSSLYGNNAFFGVVNVITRKGKDMTGLGGEVSGEAASYDTFKGRVTYGHEFTNGLELFLSGTIYDSAGRTRLFYKEFNATNSNNGIAQNADRDEYKSFFGRVAFHDFSVEGAFITREKGNPTAQFLADFNDPRLRTTDERSYVNAKYAHSFANALDVNAQVYYDRQNLDIGTPFGGALFPDSRSAEWWGAELQVTKRLWDRHTVMAGGEYRDDFRQRETTAFQEIRRSRQSHGIYLQGDFTLVTNLVLSAGGRYDQYGSFDPAFNPRLALIYNPWKETVFKALYGSAFRAPNFFELSDLRNQNIKPETITTYELVWEQGIGSHLRSSVAGFYNQIDDLIIFNSAMGHQRFENLNGVDAHGIELALDGSWAHGLRGRASYTFQETENRTTKKTLTDSPKHLAKLNVSVPVWKEKIFAGVEFQLASRRTTRRLDLTGTEQPGLNAAAYGVVNLTLFSQNLVKGLDFSASVDNLLDRRYADPSTPGHRQDLIEQDGRTFRVKLSYRF